MLTGSLWCSALVAALFAFHPLRVESVAWISERKDMLSGLFWMLTLIAYRFAIGALLPKVSYLTRLDTFILGSTLLVFASLMEAAYVTAAARHDHLDRALRMDRWAKVAFPFTFALIAIYAFGIR